MHAQRFHQGSLIDSERESHSESLSGFLGAQVQIMGVKTTEYVFCFF